MVRRVGVPATDPEGWRRYVGGVLQTLTGTGARQ
jgi:hypothetical protein